MYQAPYKNYSNRNQNFASMPLKPEKAKYQFRRIWIMLPLFLTACYLLFLFVPMMPLAKIPLLIKGSSMGAYTKVGILFLIITLIIVAAGLILG